MADQQPVTFPHIDSHNMAMLQSVGALVNGKPLASFSFAEQRELFHKMQQPSAENPGVTISHATINTSCGEVKTYLYKPDNANEDLPFVFYAHGGGWVFGGAVDFEAFLFDLVMRTGMAVVFSEYSLAPERKYPTQQEQCLEVLQYALTHAAEHGLKAEKVVLAGDSAGCQLIGAMSILNHQRSLGLPIVHQVMLHPLIDATAVIDTGIFWDPEGIEQQRSAYFSTIEERSSILGSPGLMTPDQAKQYMPATTIITAEIDGFRPEGETFGKLLQTAGVPCGHLQAMACLHDPEVFNESRGSPTAEMVMTVISAKVKEALSEGK